MSKPLADLLGDAARSNQFVIVGDTSHKKGSILQTFAQPDNFAALKQQGVKHLFLEVPREMQRSFDNLLSGKMTEEQFAADLNKRHPRAQSSDIGDRGFAHELAKVAMLAKANGMQVHCADHRQAKRKELMGGYEHYVHNRNPSATPEEYMQDVTKRRMPDGSMTHLLTDDKPLAEFVAGKAGRDKAVVFYGSGHGDSSYGIDEMLGEVRTARVEIFESKPWGISEWWNRREMKSQLNITADPDKPFGRFYIDKGEAERFEQKPTGEMTPGDIDFSKLQGAASGLEGSVPARPEPRPAGQRSRPNSGAGGPR